MSAPADYPLEDIRGFFVSRSWFSASLADRNGPLLREDEYEELKERKLRLSRGRAAVLRAFIDGWERAKA